MLVHSSDIICRSLNNTMLFKKEKKRDGITCMITLLAISIRLLSSGILREVLDSSSDTVNLRYKMDFNIHSQLFWNLFSTGARGMEGCMFEVYAYQFSSAFLASSFFYYISEIFICILMLIKRVMTPRTILEDN